MATRTIRPRPAQARDLATETGDEQEDGEGGPREGHREVPGLHALDVEGDDVAGAEVVEDDGVDPGERGPRAGSTQGPRGERQAPGRCRIG